MTVLNEKYRTHNSGSVKGYKDRGNLLHELGFEDMLLRKRRLYCYLYVLVNRHIQA